MIAPTEQAQQHAAPDRTDVLVQPAPAWWWGAYLAAIVLAELITASQRVEIGVAAHLVLVMLIPIHAVFASPAAQPLLLALVLAPLIRIVSLAMPIAGLSPANQYLLTSLPVAAAVLASMQVIGLTRREIGLRVGNLPLQLAVGLLGVPIGGFIYAILRPAPIIAELTWQTALFPAVVFLVLVGVLEETIFRGILLTLGRRTLGDWAIIYVSAIFAALHIGYLSPPHTGLVFLVGLAFAWVAARTRSILGVALAHGLTNIVVYVFLPLMVVKGGWALPDVSWTGYAHSAGPGTAPVSAPPSTSNGEAPTAIGPTPVSRQAPVADGEGSAQVAVPTVVPTLIPTATVAVAPTLQPTVVPAAIPSPAAASTVAPTASPVPPPSTTSSASPVAPRPERVAVGTAGESRVRADTSTDAPIVATVPPGTVLEIVGADIAAEGRTWRNVRLPDGQTGWIDSTLVEPVQPDAASAAVEAPGGAPSPVAPDAAAGPATAPSSEPTSAVAPSGDLPAPVQTVVRLYDALGHADFDTVLSLWSARLRDAVKLDAPQLRARPPSQELVLERADLASIDEAAGRAVVDVVVRETVDRAAGVTRRYVGNWRLVRDGDGWLVDEPRIRIE